jgi:deoxycytidylate deaminase
MEDFMSENEGSQWKLVINLLDILALGLAATPAVMKAYNDARGRVQKVVDEQRDPTAEEHAEINAIINNLRESIHAPLPKVEGKE